MTNLAVEVRELYKTYGSVTAVAGVSFAVPASSSLGIVGESGSGKTTTARMIVGLEEPTSGSVLIDGSPRPKRVSRAAERRIWARRVQIVFQNPYASLDPRQRIRRAIDEVLRLHTSLPEDARADRVTELLAQVGLDARQADALPARLSGGQRQRAAIARALACDPAVLILDEAVAALDVSIQAQIVNLLRDIQQANGMTYLFVSHDLAVIRQITDRVVVMRNGVVVEEGETDAVLDGPEHPYTRLLRDSVPRLGWRPQRRPATELGR